MKDLEAIRQRVTMRDVLAHYGIGIDRGGFAICPFHSDRHPSMKVYPNDRGWWCFVCGDGGDIFKFIQKMESCGFPQAADIAAGIGGIDGTATPRSSVRYQERQKALRAREYRHAKLHAEYITACEKLHGLNRLLDCCTTWTETLEWILTDREAVTRRIEELDEKLTAYE